MSSNPLHEIKEIYFAAVNSQDGFVSYFDEIFSQLSKLYIIKGGPGTGKSRLMREIADSAEQRGYRVEYYYCSADDRSLDGILIHGLEIGVIDGTFPHTREPEMVGALEEILNLGVFWDSEKLGEKLETIRLLTEQKSKLYDSVYDLLAASGRVEAAARTIGMRALNQEKLNAAADRLFHGIRKNDVGNEEIRILSCIGMNGEVRFHTFEQMAKHRILVRDRAGTASLFLRALRHCAAAHGLHVKVSCSPLDPSLEDALYIEELETVCMLEENADEVREDDRMINMARFLDSELLRENRAKLRFLHRIAAELKQGALHSLSEIKKAHFALEEIYASSMDFDAKEAFTDELIARIFH